MTEYNSLETTEGTRTYPIDDHGKIRVMYFSYTAPSGGLAANDTIVLAKLPTGRKRLLPGMSQIKVGAFGAGRTLDVGHKAYQNRPAAFASMQAEDPDAFIDGLDVSSAVAAQAWASDDIKYDLYSLDEIDVFATVLGNTMPADATIEGYIAYVYE